MVFKCAAGTPTTGGSSNPRCELREMTSDGKKEIYWDMRASSLRAMDLIVKVVRTPSSGKVCFAQIHGKESRGYDDIIRLQVRTSPNAKEGDRGTVYVMGDAVNDKADDLFSYTLGQELTMRIEANNSTVRIYRNQTRLREYTNLPSPENYFKAGAYLQSKPKSGYGQTEFRLIKTIP